MKQKNYPLYKVEKFDDFREMLDNSAEAAEDKPAFMFRRQREIVEVSYEKFNETTKALSNALWSLGLGEEHIAMTGENNYEWITVFLTVLAGKNVFVPIDKELPFDEIINILNESECKAVFYWDKFEAQMKENREKLPNIKYFINIAKSKDDEENEFISLEGLLLKGKEMLDEGDESYKKVMVDDTKLKMLVYTSGTTGRAKGVMLSLRNLVSCVYNGLQVAKMYSRSLSVLPYHHTYEAVCDVLASLHQRNTVCINESLRTVMINLKEYKPDYILLVPLFAENFYKRIWKTAEDTGKADTLRKLIKTSNNLRKLGIDQRKTFFKNIHESFGGNLKKIICGGAPVREEISEFFNDIGIDFTIGYGITECSPLVSCNRDKYNNSKSVGVLLPCVECRIDEPNEDGEGEILVRGDTVMMGYYKNPIATEAVLGKGRWFHTGDYGKMNKEGQLFITGRKKNLIVLRNGKNVYPEEIEEYLMSIPYIAEVVVFANKNEEGEEVSLCAEVFLVEDKVKELSKEERKTLIKAEIDKVNSTLPSYKNILTIRIRTKEFEKTTSKKIKRSDIGEHIE